MKNEIEADYSKCFLLPPSIENWVPRDHPSRFIKEFVDKLNLSELEFKDRKNQEGRPNYSNKLLLKICLYGYFEKIYSTRELEKACKDRMALIWLTGMNYPDHNTIWRFFKRNRDCIKNVFKQTVHIAIENNMVGFVLQSIDGTKIYANASNENAIYKKDLKKLLSKLDKSLDEIVSEIDNTEQKESSKPLYTLPEELQSRDKLQNLIRKGLEKYSRKDKKRLKRRVSEKIEELDKKNLKSISLTDQESRMMKNYTSIDFCYNAQSVVDEKNQIVVGAKVTNEAVDSHQMVNMLDLARFNCNKKAKETVLDGGYFTVSELKKAEEKGYSVLTPCMQTVGQSKKVSKNQSIEFSKSKFKYNSKEDIYICPEGKRLVYSCTMKPKSRSYPIRRYGCKDHIGCKSKDKCIKDKTGRKIDRTPYDDAIVRQNQKNNLEENKNIYKKRKYIIEPLFGWIKHNNGFNKWLYRGLNNVDAQWNMVCTGINLYKLFNVWKKTGLDFG